RSGTRVEAVRAAAPCGKGHLRARGLLSLSLADDPSAARRNPALWSSFGGRRVRVRPAVPVGLQAHRPRSRTRRRQVLRCVAAAASRRSARGCAGIEHAGLSMAAIDGARRRRYRGAHARAARPGRSLLRQRRRRGFKGGRRQDRAGRPGRLSARAGGFPMNPLWGHLVGIVTLVLMLVFIGIWAWAWLPHHKSEFDALAK